jgi:DNA modification methylase
MEISVATLKSHPINAEIYTISDVEDLAESIDEVGLLSPLVIDQHQQVISGNRRFAAIQKLGWEKVEVTQVDVTSDDAPILIVHHNKQRVKTNRETLNEYRILHAAYSKGQGARTDLFPTLVDTNQSYTRTRDRVADELNVPSGRLAHLVYIDDHEPDLIDEIDKGKITLNIAYRYITKKKKVTESLKKTPSPPPQDATGWFKFYQKSSANMSELGDGEVDMIFTSPPYYALRAFTTDENELGRESTPEEFVDALADHLRDCYRVLNDKGSFYLNLGDTQVDGTLLNIPHRVAMKLQEQGWLQRSAIIWRKSNASVPPTPRQVKRTYEFIFHLTKTTENLHREMRVPNRTEGGDKIESGVYMPRLSDGSGVRKPVITITHPRGRAMGDYWDEDIVTTAVSNQTNRNTDNIDHPAVFNETIVELPILQSTDENDLVLDPFAGSCTTGKVANRLNRRFVGYDLRWYGTESAAE